MYPESSTRAPAWRRALRPVLVFGLLCLLAACERPAASLDQDESRDALVQRALERKRAQQPDEAIQGFTQALERKPRLARAHLELGLLYDQKADYLRAMYHYQRYLELRPQAEKKKIVEDLIRQARLSLLASLPTPPPGAVERIVLLQKEIAGLRNQTAVLQNQLGQFQKENETLRQRLGIKGAPAIAAPVPAPPPAAAVTPPPAPRPLDARPPARTVVVQPHDTLARIASRVYQDRTQWKKIYDANRDVLTTPQSVRVGQTLVIP